MPESPDLPQVWVTIIVHDDGTQHRVRTDAEGTSAIDSYDGAGKKPSVFTKILNLATGKDGDEIWESVESVDNGSHAEVVGNSMLHDKERLAQVRSPGHPSDEWRGKTAADYPG